MHISMNGSSEIFEICALSLLAMRVSDTYPSRVCASSPYGLEVNTMDNANIARDHLGRLGLHLNAKGNEIFVSNLVNKFQCL